MKHFIAAVLLSIGGTILSLILHLIGSFDTMINCGKAWSICNSYLEIAVNLHKDYPVFAKRPLVNFLVDQISGITGMNIGWSFTTLNFVLLFICGVLVYQAALVWTKNKQYALVAIPIFMLGFTILFAFFPAIYTYDDMLQYVFLLLAMIFLKQEKWLLYILTFSISLIARESGALLIPGLLFIILPSIKINRLFEKDSILKIIYLSIPVGIYMTFLYVFIRYNNWEEASQQDLNDRFSHLVLNFQDKRHSIETFISFFLALGFPIYLCVRALKRRLDEQDKKVIYGFFITIIINTIVVITCTKARETRLYALPLILLWPLMGKMLMAEYELFRDKLRTKGFKFSWKPVLLCLAVCFIGFYINKKLYDPTIVDRHKNFHNEYFGILWFMLTIHFFLMRKTISNKFTGGEE